jgi:hypothetical protein
VSDGVTYVYPKEHSDQEQMSGTLSGIWTGETNHILYVGILN